MSVIVRSAAVALIVLAAIFALVAGGSLLIALVLIALAVVCALLPVVSPRPSRAALLLAVVAVTGGGVAAGVRVVDGVAHSRIQYHGKLDVHEIRRTFNPTGPAGLGDPLPAIKRLGYGYISSGQAVMTVPHAGAGVLALWSIQELAPWLLAAIVLGLLAPILRAAGRGDPFWEGATRRLTGIGSLLLVGIPTLAILRYVLAQAGTTVRPSPAPNAEPVLTLSVGQLLPGALVLTLAAIFRAGVELREFERHAV